MDRTLFNWNILDNSMRPKVRFWLPAAAYNSAKVFHVKTLQEIPVFLKEKGIYPRLTLDGTVQMMTAVRASDDHNRFYIMYRNNSVILSPEDPNPDETLCSAMYRKGTTKGSYQRPGKSSAKVQTVRLKGKGRVWLCDPWSGTEKEVPFIYDAAAGSMAGTVQSEEDEMIIFRLETENNKNVGIVWSSLALQEFKPDTESETSMLRSSFDNEKIIINLKQLKPWKELNPSLEHFAGKGIYSGHFFLHEREADTSCILHLGEVCDTFTIKVNGNKTAYPDQAKLADISDYVQSGDNLIEVEVVGNLYNRLFSDDMKQGFFPVKYRPRAYGMWETEDKKIYIEICRR